MDKQNRKTYKALCQIIGEYYQDAMGKDKHLQDAMHELCALRDELAAQQRQVTLEDLMADELTRMVDELVQALPRTEWPASGSPKWQEVERLIDKYAGRAAWMAEAELPLWYTLTHLHLWHRIKHYL